MFNYKVVGISAGMPRTVFVSATDIAQAAYNSGMMVYEIIRVELIDTVEQTDLRAESV